jgi:predicted Zn-dependent protease
LGQYPLAIEPARKALALNPHIAAAWVILAQALLQAGQIEEAKSICNQAIANNLAEGAIRSTLMKIAALQNDTAALQAQLDWAANSSGVSYIRVGSASLAFARGQAELGRQLIGELAAYYKQHGMANMGSFYLLASARQLADEGYAQDAKKLLDSIPLLPGMTDPLIALAEIGEPDRAADILKQELSQHPRGTLWLDYKGPQVRAAILLAEHKPQEAIAALERSRALDHRGYDVLYLRGNAYLAAGQPVLAAQQFRDILDHPSIDPLDYQYPLARLGLARAYAMSGSKPEARTEYAKLFAAWKNADPDLPVLKQARAEYAHL